VRASCLACNASSGRAGAVLDRLRRDRLVDLLRARDHRAARARLHAAVLLAAGLLFLVVSLSYAEGTAAIRETGGAATFVRIAFNDFWGFVTGWVLFLDYLIVIALSALFVPHYVAGAFFTKVHRPGTSSIGCCVIAAIAVVRLVHRTRLHRWALVVASSTSRRSS
jgi:amino acid transporter